MNKWQNPSLSLGERCVAFAENELKNGVAEDKPGSYTSPRLRDYFSICTRLTKGKEVPMTGFTAGNWCAAGASFCLYNSLLPGETLPHGYRLGVVEIIADLQAKGLYHQVSDVKKGNYQIKVGDIIIFDRSDPKNPASSWWRHIGRVYSVNGDNFQCISGNSGGKWKISNHKFSQKNLLGFGQYPKLNYIVPNTNTTIDLSHIDANELAPKQDTGNFNSTSIFDYLSKLFNKNNA